MTIVDELVIGVSPTGNNDEIDQLALKLQKQKDRRRLFQRRFLSNLSRIGLLMETVCS